MQSVHACAVQTHIRALFLTPFSRPQKNRKIQMVLTSRQGHLGHISDKGGTGGLGWPWGVRRVLEGKCAKFIVFFCRKWRDRPFRLAFGGVTLTISAACQQKLIAAGAPRHPPTLPLYRRKAARTPTADAVWGMTPA